jgi:predicted permease
MIRHLSVRLASLFKRERLERELDVELRYHLDMLVQQNLQQGLSPEAARREALRVFGTVAGVKDDVRDSWLPRLFETAAQDVRYGIRSLRRNPGFALVIVITMALGIGANTAIFSVVNAVLLRPLPYRDGDKLVVLHQGQALRADPVGNDIGFSPKEMDDYRQARSLSDVVEFHSMFFNLLGRAEPERLSTGVVSANYFDVLGVKPLHGRTFVAADDEPGAPAVLVLSNKYWMRSFGGDPSVIGKVFRMNDKPHTVVGIMPLVPQYPLEVDVYMPSSACPFRSSPALIANRRGRMLTAFARVKPEVALQKSQADLDIVAAQLRSTYRDFYPPNGFEALGVPLKNELTRDFTSTLWVLLGTAGFVLLIVCASIANLLLARMVRREREMSVRAALGATRGRLLRQLLTESLILAVTGGVLGLLLSALSLQLLVVFAERFTPRAHEISIDPTVLFFTLAISVVTGLVFGSIPAFSRRVDVAPALREGMRSSHSSQKVRSGLIVAQVSASFMLLIAAGLTLRSLMLVQSVDPGFKTENLLTMRADMSFDKFPVRAPDRGARMSAYWTEFEDKLRAIPGVLEVGGGGTFPLNESEPFPGGFEREFHPLPPDTPRPQVSFRFATPEYFKTFGQPIVAGRSFAPGDGFDAPRVAVINQSAARKFWPGEDPVGQRIRGFGNGSPWVTVVGVAADIRQQLDRTPVDEIYVPIKQNPLLGTTWVVHSRVPAEQMVRAIKTMAQAHDPDLPVASFRTLAEVRSTALAPRRVVVALIGLFGLLALVITAAGIAGVIAFSVNQRTHEFGIRMALGARRAGVLALVVREGLVLVTLGLVLGLAGAVILTRVLGSVIFARQPASGLTLLFNIQATDTPTYLGVGAVLVLVADGGAAHELVSATVGSTLASDGAMSLRATMLFTAVLLTARAQQGPAPHKLPALLNGDDLIALTLQAPLQELFAKGVADETFTVAGTLRYRDPATSTDVALNNVEVAVRGHTSRRETECTFPKLKLKLKGSGSIKIGSHCGEAADDLTTKYGRLANEKSPYREALVYQLLKAVDAPTLRARPARITYVDPAQPEPLVRNALLLEDDDDAMARVKGTAELPMETFGNVATRGAADDAVRIAFAEAMVGNFDWCLKFSPDDIYRCNEPKPLWNVLAFDRGDGKAALVMKDFDLAGVVVGRHNWFKTVWNPAFVPSKSETEIEVLSQVQRTRSLFPRAALDAERRHFLERKAAVYEALQRAPVDAQGRQLARAYLDSFFSAIADDGQFYRPVVARSDVQVFLDAAATKEACGPKDVMRPGTPVNEIQKSGAMSQVVILDANWRWASKSECNGVQDGPVWIKSEAITRDYPVNKSQ